MMDSTMMGGGTRMGMLTGVGGHGATVLRVLCSSPLLEPTSSSVSGFDGGFGRLGLVQHRPSGPTGIGRLKARQSPMVAVFQIQNPTQCVSLD